MAGLMLSARESHKEISITCPLCKFGSKISVSYLEDAIHDGLEITCCVCEHPFKIVVMPLEMAQSNTGLQRTYCECGEEIPAGHNVCIDCSLDPESR